MGIVSNVLGNTHVLNGDALQERFPTGILGNRFICRECLIDGPVQSNSLEHFYDLRSAFLCSEFEHPRLEYRTYSESEFDKIQNIETKGLFLWFEEDLFCQINFWFVSYLLHTYSTVERVFLVLPNLSNRYGFSGMTDEDLYDSFQKNLPISKFKLQQLSSLWSSYSCKDLDALKSLGEHFTNEWTFVNEAVQLELSRQKDKEGLSSLHYALMDIQKQTHTTDFATVFQTFSQKYPQYGLGDMQVMNLLKDLQERK